jgi:hypothetical protein
MGSGRGLLLLILIVYILLFQQSKGHGIGTRIENVMHVIRVWYGTGLKSCIKIKMIGFG